MLYFAYGSNLSPTKLSNNRIFPFYTLKAKLLNYKLVFNKKSYKYNISYANIEECKDSVVEGLVFIITENEINILDKIEGFPKHYYKKEIEVLIESGVSLKAFTYIAVNTTEKYLPTKEYLNLIIENENIFSKEYLNKLKKQKTC